MINIDSFQELVESMDIIAENRLKTASQIYYCLVKRLGTGNKCVIDFNNKEYSVSYFAGKPIPNKTYALFLPQNNMNQAFIVGEGGSGGGGGGSGIAVQPDPPTGDELVWIDTDDPGTQHIIPEVKDNEVSQYDTWSSAKISSEIPTYQTISASVNYSLAGGGSFNTNLKTAIDAYIPSGYHFFTIAGYATNDARVLITNMFYGDSIYSLYLKNLSADVVPATMTFSIVVEKD